MVPGYRIMLKTALDLQFASLAAGCRTLSLGLNGLGGAQPIHGIGRVGALMLLAELDLARGKRPVRTAAEADPHRTQRLAPAKVECDIMPAQQTGPDTA